MVLLVKHEPALRAFARALVPDWDRVDEPLPEASVTIWEQRDQLNSREGFLPRPSDPELQVPAAVGEAPLAAPDRVPYALAAFAEAPLRRAIVLVTLLHGSPG